MSGKIIDYKTSAITAATTTGYITVASVTGYYETAVVTLLDSGGANSIECMITEVLTTSNQLGIVRRNTNAGSVPNYGRSNISAYNGGTIIQQEQFVYNSNDKPLS